MAIIKNLTPHTVTIIDPTSVTYDARTRKYSIRDKEVGYHILKQIEPEGVLTPRCIQTECKVESKYHDIPYDVFHIVFGEVEHLPPREEGVYYVVSNLIAQACPNRDDLLIPAHLVRDDEGRIVGCLGFAIA